MPFLRLTTKRFLAVILLVLVGMLFFYPASLSRFFWEELSSPLLALLLPHDDAPLVMEIGTYYFGIGVYDLFRAKHAFQKAVAIEPSILWGHYQLARILFVEGEWAKALEEINEELDQNPENLRSLYVRGLIYASMGYIEDAVKDFEHFVLWAPTEWAGYNDLAWVLAKEGENEKVVAVIERAFEKVPGTKENPWLLNTLGVAYLNSKEYEKAHDLFAEAEHFADSLSLSAWSVAYPGNSPDSHASGLEAFRAAIEVNKETARDKMN
jgi:tetratricopeptide (TPR) repeat protein